MGPRGPWLPPAFRQAEAIQAELRLAQNWAAQEVGGVVYGQWQSWLRFRQERELHALRSGPRCEQ